MAPTAKARLCTELFNEVKSYLPLSVFFVFAYVFSSVFCMCLSYKHKIDRLTFYVWKIWFSASKTCPKDKWLRS